MIISHYSQAHFQLLVISSSSASDYLLRKKAIFFATLSYENATCLMSIAKKSGEKSRRIVCVKVAH